MIFNTKKKYLQIAFNSSLNRALKQVKTLPQSDQIVIEIGTPLIKERGSEAIRLIGGAWQAHCGVGAIAVADLKCMDRGITEVDLGVKSGAKALTCLGLAPLETIDYFIANCRHYQVASMVDMLNVPFPFEILQNLKLKPDVVVLHRGADEYHTEVGLPLHEISRIKGAYANVLVSLAGVETPQDVRRAFFNGVDIAVVWRDFNLNDTEGNQISDYLASFKSYGK